MPYILGTPPDVTESLPFPLTEAGQAASSAFTNDSTYDVAFNGVGFLLRLTDASYQRAGKQTSKDQLDTSNEAGEQSLGAWWTRSQVSWHRGAGIVWYEPGSQDDTEFRFHTSQGVNVWDQGEVSLLHDTTTLATGLAGNTFLTTLRRGGVDGVVVASNSSLTWRTDSGVGLSATLPSGSATQPAASGGLVWVGHATGVSKWDTTSAGSLTTPITGTNLRAWWAKGRLFIASGNKLWWATSAYTGAITAADDANHGLLYTHPDPAWVWTDVTETADSVLASGYCNSESLILSFGVTNDSTTSLPVLTSGREVAKLPLTEQIMCMGAYLSGFVVLGTTAGVRVGVVGSDGQVQYGPLTIETTNPVLDVSFSSRFAYVTASREFPDGTSGVARIDLSQEIGSGTNLYAWAWDVSARNSGDVSSVALVGNTKRAAIASGGALVFEHPTTLVSGGWLESGRVRYQTAEDKVFRYAKLSGVLNNGTVQVTAIDPAGVEHAVIQYTPATGVEGEAAIIIPQQPKNAYLSFRVYLVPTAGQSPVVSGLNIKALPAVKTPQLVQFPLSCFDYEVKSNGERVGFAGSAWPRVAAFESVRDSAAPVYVVDNRTGEAFWCTIESVTFEGKSVPDRADTNWGGLLTVQVRQL